jgi:arabinose-5-phosphate isomerase
MSGARSPRPFASTGTPAYFVHPGEASHGDLGMITPDDVIMALSWSGETVELKDLIDYSRRFRTGLIAVTADADSTLAQAADVRAVLPQAREACPHNLAPTTSSLMQLRSAMRSRRAAGKPRLHGARFRGLHPGGGSAQAEIHPRRHAHRRAVPLSPLGTACRTRS